MREGAPLALHAHVPFRSFITATRPAGLPSAIGAHMPLSPCSAREDSITTIHIPAHAATVAAFGMPTRGEYTRDGDIERQQKGGAMRLREAEGRRKRGARRWLVAARPVLFISLMFIEMVACELKFRGERREMRRCLPRISPSC